MEPRNKHVLEFQTCTYVLLLSSLGKRSHFVNEAKYRVIIFYSSNFYMRRYNLITNHWLSLVTHNFLNYLFANLKVDLRVWWDT